MGNLAYPVREINGSSYPTAIPFDPNDDDLDSLCHAFVTVDDQNHGAYLSSPENIIMRSSSPMKRHSSAHRVRKVKGYDSKYNADYLTDVEEDDQNDHTVFSSIQGGKKPSPLLKGTRLLKPKVIVLDEAQAIEENPSLALQIVPTVIDTTNTKCILLIGGTGSGKSTTLNSMVNYLYGIEFDHPYRYKLIEEQPNENRRNKAESQTNQVIGYLLENVPKLQGNNCLVIDTPGFGDSRGMAADEKTVRELKCFFEQKIELLHAVCFVMKASDKSLNPSQEYLISSILGIFGQDIADNIAITVTFSDAQIPPCLEVIKEAKIPYSPSRFFKLNNSAFFLNESDEKDFIQKEFGKMFYKLGISSFESLFSWVMRTEPKISRLCLFKLRNIRRNNKISLHLLENIKTGQKLLNRNLNQLL